MAKLTEQHILLLEKGVLSCQDIEDSMCDYADGDLPEMVKARVDEHIEQCEKCRDLCDSYLYTIKVAHTLRTHTPITSDIQNRLRAALNERLGISLSVK